MAEKSKEMLPRRDVLRALSVGASAAALTAAAATVAGPAEARESREEQRRARYQPNSPHVQAFYRVNRY